MTDIERTERVTKLVDEMVAAARKAGMVAAISGNDGVIYDSCTGQVGLSRDDKCGCALGALALHCGVRSVKESEIGRGWPIRDLSLPLYGPAEYMVKVPSWVDYEAVYLGNDEAVGFGLGVLPTLFHRADYGNPDRDDSYRVGAMFAIRMGVQRKAGE